MVEEIIKELSGTMYHEFNHAYEDFMRKSNGNPGLLVSGSLKNQTANLAEYFEVPAAQRFFRLLYLSIATEMNARVPQLIPQLKSAKTNEEKISIIKNSAQWGMNQQLIEFNAGEWVNEMGSELSMGGLLPKQFAIQGIQETINGMMNLINGMADHGQEFIDYLKKETPDLESYNWEDISAIYEKQAKLAKHLLDKEPTEYFEYWQRVFNNRGEYGRRKLLRLASY